MLVYGDPQFTSSVQVFIKQLRARVERANVQDAGEVRALLIQAGQLEQGLWDFSDERTPQPQQQLYAAMQLTDAAARALLSPAKAAVQLDRMRQAMDQLQQLQDLPLKIKVPEGYEFYGLFPEQYFRTALKWVRTSNADGSVLVVGIRSIGTSLSAAVCAALNDEGRPTERLTVRPTGHPFQRQAIVKRHDPAKWNSVIIVDEGPGLSGSSVAAVCRALEAQGFVAKQFHIFPGHDRGPGVSSSTEVRRWWSNVPRWTADPTDLTEALLARSAELSRNWGDQSRMDDVSGGKWRRLFGIPEENWPPAMIPFERPKYLCGSDRGAKVLWKFVGLGAAYEGGSTSAELAMLKLAAVAKAGLGLAPLGTFNGFVAMPWIEGSPLELKDAPGVIARIGEYVIRFAGPPLTSDGVVQARNRVALMVETNTREALGEGWARVAKRRTIEDRDLKVLESYGDGRLAPHEWLWDVHGNLLKTDCFGHDVDHTCVGKQSLLWDVAGLAIEWALPKARVGDLLQVFNRQGVCIDDEVFAMYQLGYAAFRVGQCAVCEDSVSDGQEQARLRTARKRYCQALQGLLS